MNKGSEIETELQKVVDSGELAGAATLPGAREKPRSSAWAGGMSKPICQ